MHGVAFGILHAAKKRDVDNAKLNERSTFLRGAPLHEAALTQSVRPPKQPTSIARCCTWSLARTPQQQRSPFGSPCPADSTMTESMDDVDALLEQQLKATKTDENDRSGHEGRKRDEREKHSDRCGFPVHLVAPRDAIAGRLRSRYALTALRTHHLLVQRGHQAPVDSTCACHMRGRSACPVAAVCIWNVATL